MTKPNLLDKLEKLVKDTSRSPWIVRKDEATGEYSSILDRDGFGMAIDLLDEDAKFISAANPATVLRLCKALRLAMEIVEWRASFSITEFAKFEEIQSLLEDDK